MVRQSSTGRYLVTPHDPWKVWALRVTIILVAIVIGWGCFELGILQAGYQRTASHNEIQEMTEQLGALKTRIEELTEENAQLQSNNAIDATATKQVNQRLDQLNQETLELKEELVFYRSLLSPSELEPGLQILGVQLVKDAKDNIYGYKVVLTQRRNRNLFADGVVEMQINGTQEGEAVLLDSKTVLADKKGELKFKFKNFQSLEGQLSLPEGFEPQAILVKVNPRSRSLKRIERNYEWNSIVTGG
ncbi:MAG: hypothetical protein JXA04_03310 [Gammaproteobacteria bacterium]|nr:hypothetical protein [Gammaproteobacteria bacterium]